MKWLLASLTCCCLLAFARIPVSEEKAWIRINQLGYTPDGIKVAVWCSQDGSLPDEVSLVNRQNGQVVYTIRHIQGMGTYGPFNQTARLNFSAFNTSGTYYLEANGIRSPEIRIHADVYKGSADFCLRYMRQQRSGFNPFLNDSCHTRDGYTLYGPMPDSTFIPVSGGWHDASDYLQYTTTSANATWHLFSAYRDFPDVFTDAHQANGLKGSNTIPDVLDEARWGLNWLLKMNPADEIMFNQLGDDRDHRGMRIPKEDTNYYGRGIERPIYFVSGKPQVRGKFRNATTGVASTAGKFASTFALASLMYQKQDPALAKTLYQKSLSAYAFGQKLPGVAQTASVLSPYIYAEGNWVDDMELAAASLLQHNNGKQAGYRKEAMQYAAQEPVTPWLGKDTAQHYQWYPFINLGHRELLRTVSGDTRDTLSQYYEKGIDAVWQKARQNAFYRGIPFIWCSNNLTVAFAMQCYWYRVTEHDNSYAELEQANIDWLFGCNPWGTSMVYGLPSWGDTPIDPHSAFTHLKNYPIDGGLVDGPVYTSIYKGLIGIQLKDADEYAQFQSNLAVYHDDYGDYSTNEPTMDGTASLIYLLAAKEQEARKTKQWTGANPFAFNSTYQQDQGAVIRGDRQQKNMALVFTGDEDAEGLKFIRQALKEAGVKASFFFTGRFYRNPKFLSGIRQLHADGHYLGPHSDGHLLYNDWVYRDSTLVTRDSLLKDYRLNIAAMRRAGVYDAKKPAYYIPPYEWWNKTVARWLRNEGVKLFSFTPGTRTNADYTWPKMGNAYVSSEKIMAALQEYQQRETLNGTILLMHVGVGMRRMDKLYYKLPELIRQWKAAGYVLETVDRLIK
ncbi:MAG: polysaccharide deacetylase family protein [Chitinophagaceae bacterium]|nr:polysaccharide deacetylase family protein [Chitinophagaceae bacterium]